MPISIFHWKGVIWSNIGTYWFIACCFMPHIWPLLWWISQYCSLTRITSISTAKDTGLYLKTFNVLNRNLLHQPRWAILEESRPWKGGQMDQQKIEWSSSRCRESRPPGPCFDGLEKGQCYSKLHNYLQYYSILQKTYIEILQSKMESSSSSGDIESNITSYRSWAGRFYWSDPPLHTRSKRTWNIYLALEWI